MSEVNLTDDELIAWFKNRPLPEGKFRINAVTTTDNLTNIVELAMGNLNRDKSIARTRLLEVKAKLEVSAKSQNNATSH